MAQGDLTNIISVYTAGYIIFQIPNTLMLLVVRPSYWFPINGLCWAVLTCCCAAAKSSDAIHSIRFFQGGFESITFSGAMFVLGSWYRVDELAKRTAIFCISGHLGSVSASLIQAAIHKNLSGATSLPSWRLQFVIDGEKFSHSYGKTLISGCSGVIVVPVALYGLLCFPDLPKTTRAWFLSEEERRMAVERLPPALEVDFSPRASKEAFKRVMSSWHIYLLPLFFSIVQLPEGYG